MKTAAFIFFLFFSINTFAQNESTAHSMPVAYSDTVKQQVLPSTSGLKADTVHFMIRDPAMPSKPHKPLIVVNGVFYKGNLNIIAPNDIQSIDILKGAKALSLYGKRGKYGVVIIKMKPNYKIGTLISN